MARLRFVMVGLLALGLAGSSNEMGRTQGESISLQLSDHKPAGEIKKHAADERSCVIYSLTDMGYDSDFGRWIAQAIPDIVESKSWQQYGGSGALRYYAPKNILIVNHSPRMQAKVDGFLKKLKTSLPKASQTGLAKRKKSSHASIVPADYRTPPESPVRTSNPLPEPSSYPVPAPVKAPKHLFHFLIRYEGEGLIDDNVVKFMKGYMQAETGAVNKQASQSVASDQPSDLSPSISPYSGGTTLPGTTSAPTVQPPSLQQETKEQKKEKPAKETR